MLEIIILTAALISNVLIGLLILLKNTRSATYRYFFATAISFTAYSLINYLSLHPVYFSQLTWIRLDLLSGVFLFYFVYLTFDVFPNQSFTHKSLLRRIITIYTFLLAGLVLTPLVFSDLKLVDGYAQPVPAPGIVAFAFHQITLLVIALAIIIKKLLAASGLLRTQIKYILAGTGFALISIIIFNFVFVNIFHNTKFVVIGPISVLIFTISFAYDMTRHKFLDIRLGLVRTLGFIITVGIVATIYSLLILGIATPLVVAGPTILDAELIKRLLLLIPPTLFVGLTFHSLQTYISRLTRKIFYQDDYDLKATIDKLSDVLITNLDIESLARESLIIISLAIKCTNIYIVILNDDGDIIYELAQNTSAPQAIAQLVKDIQNIPVNPIVRDLLDADEVPDSILEQDISLVLKLGPKKHINGMVLIGPKQNGTNYNTKDIDLLSIAAKNFSLAVENAKKYEQIIHFADTLKEEVDKATVKLRKANTRLKSLDVLKNDFISMASHQLRSPATSVYEALHMLNHPALTKKDRAELIKLAEANSERLVTVVKTMLNMARIQAGKFTIDKSEEDIGNLVDKVISETGIVASQREIKLITNKPSQPIIKSIDSAKIHEAMANYIENAIKYSPKKSEVKIDLYTTEDKIVFEVRDSGMGVPLAERDSLFGKFYRATNARVEEPDGNGIGLYVVRSIALGHNGEAYYKPLDNGSLFGFWIPLEHNGKQLSK